MSKFVAKDLSGKRFGMLTALYRTNETDKKGCYKWLCQCDCGNTTVVSGDNLRENGGTRSCGCNRLTKTMEEYEAAKRTELSSITSKWEYVRCYDRSNNKHIVKCACCETERIVAGLRNIPDCLPCRKAESERQREQSKYKACANCGEIFKPKRSTAMYCSERCSKAAYMARHIDDVREKRKTHKRLREAKATGNGKVDYSITLARLIERDNHVCQLCGREVNENDYVYVGDTFIAGNDYPSIDHIKPLSKGGVHQWNNVQLAHRLCNSIKNNAEK